MPTKQIQAMTHEQWAALKAAHETATPGPWFYSENKHTGLGLNHDEERVYSVEIRGDPVQRDGSRWFFGKRRWASRLVALIQDYCKWTDHPANRDLIIDMRNSLPAILAYHECAEKELSQYRWRPISEIHEDLGPCVLMHIDDPGRLEVGTNLDLDFNESDWTHFSEVPKLTGTEAERLRAVLGAK